MRVTHVFVTIFSISTAARQCITSVDQIATFSHFAENIALRSNGDILVTSLTTPSVLYVDPQSPNSTTLLPEVSDATGISGITQVTHDVFAIIAGVWNITARRSEQTAIWTLDFRQSPATRPIVEKVADVEDTTALNGLTTIPGTSIVLGSDSATGAVFRVNVETKEYSIAISDEAFAPTGPAPSLGINGIRVEKSTLYFANSATGAFGRVPISRTGSATGPLEFIAQFNVSDTEGIDDFALDEGGPTWVAMHPDRVVRVDCDGRQEVIASGGVVSDPTSIVIGGRDRRQKTLYVTTNIISEQTVGGVVAINLRAGCT